MSRSYNYIEVEEHNVLTERKKTTLMDDINAQEQPTLGETNSDEFVPDEVALFVTLVFR